MPGGDEPEQRPHVRAAVAQRRPEALGAGQTAQFRGRGQHVRGVEPARVDEVIEAQPRAAGQRGPGGMATTSSSAAMPSAVSGLVPAMCTGSPGLATPSIRPSSIRPVATCSLIWPRSTTRIARFRASCGGFQHMLLEFARDVCGLAGLRHAETDPDAVELLLVPLTCSPTGHEGAIRVAAGTLAERILGAGRTVERYHCAYGANPEYVATLQAHGPAFSGHDDAGDVRIAELPDHPFFLGTLFQPELADEPRPHPIIRAFAEAVVRHPAAAGV